MYCMDPSSGRMLDWVEYFSGDFATNVRSLPSSASSTAFAISSRTAASCLRRTSRFVGWTFTSTRSGSSEMFTMANGNLSAGRSVPYPFLTESARGLDCTGLSLILMKI
ncbi:MAG: hypothetical protein A4E38_01036 [Methanoregulaceae archaeon PtaB.Bin108]|nr:MAG: hypothetical protein A4E38_01036 [Methanoregulaceae archaeon PtaB.Bin108]